MSYGYSKVEDKGNSPMVFGLNHNCATLKQFNYIPNGGKNGAEQDALEIIFTVNGTDVGYRQFPIVKAFGKDNEQITDPNAPEMQEAFKAFTSTMTHLMHCFVEDELLQKALSQPVAGFKEYCDILASLLPPKFNEIPLDLFFSYPWNPNKEGKKFLRLPANMKQGRWVSKSVMPQGSWKEVKDEASSNNPKALQYIDDAGNIHPFTRNTWFLNNEYANSGSNKKEESASTSVTASMNEAKPPVASSWGNNSTPAAGEPSPLDNQ